MDSALLAELRTQLLVQLATVDLLIAQSRCAGCGRTAARMQPWTESDGTTVWLGPSCHRDRVEADEAGADFQLPITPPVPTFGPPHPTCKDITGVGRPPGSEWVCGPDCPPAQEDAP